MGHDETIWTPAKRALSAGEQSNTLKNLGQIEKYLGKESLSSLMATVHGFYFGCRIIKPTPYLLSSPLVKIAALPDPGVRPFFFLASSSDFSCSMFLTNASISSTGSISINFPGAIMAISMFFAPVCTTSNNDLMVNLIVVSLSISSLWFRSRNSRTVLLDLPIAFAFL